MAVMGVVAADAARRGSGDVARRSTGGDDRSGSAPPGGGGTGGESRGCSGGVGVDSGAVSRRMSLAASSCGLASMRRRRTC